MGSSALSNLSRLVALIWALAFSPAAQAEQGCVSTQTLIKGGFGELRFTVELADEPAERAQGLMHREAMARNAGMLFVFEQPQPVAFWMKNTLIPLDMIFVDRTGRIQHIHSNAIPHDETPISGGNGVYAVLEINGGLSAKYGIKPGDALQHPAFSGGPAVIACKE